MFRIESYVTPILLSYVDKYVKDFKPADAQVSLWGGGVALHNLVLKADVLQQEVALPFTLVSGRIHELLIQVPWTKIMSEPIVVTIDTIECILSLNPPTTSDEAASSESPSPKPHVVEAPPGYMQALVRRIVSNIALRVHHLIVKYVHDDIVMSLNVKHLAVNSAGADWEPAFADIDQSQPVIRRLVTLDDLTLCLDRADSDGKIRFYQEPLLYRCQLDLRVLTKLVSANTRRARSLSVHMKSSKLAWGVTTDQLTLLLRLIRERSVDVKPPTPAPKGSTTTLNAPQTNQSSTSVPIHSESWSDWAWSWLPTWTDRDGIDEAPTAPTPIPVNFTAYLDDVSLVFKVMENESNSRKRARSFLELTATHAAIKSYICAPTVTRVFIATRNLTVLSKGKCVCGHMDYNALNEEPTVYLRKIQDSDPQPTWTWPEDQFTDVEVASAAEECYRSSDSTENKERRDTETQMSDLGVPEEPTCVTEEQKIETEEFWTRMGPLVFIEYSHERMPPSTDTNPYESPPLDFQYSDWVEESMMKITIKPVEVFVCMTLIHRLSVFKTIYQELPPVPTPEIAPRVLTVEECEALSENLPQRRITLEALGLRVRLLPWDHSQSERPSPPNLCLLLDLPKSVMVVNGPLYPIRVCTAACQIPEDTSTIWQGARLHVTVKTSVAFAITSQSNKETRPCARAEIQAVAHTLLNSHLFKKKESVLLGFSIKVVEANVCGSFARLYAALEVPMSLFREQYSNALRYTSLAYDALNDEELVAIDITLEDMVFRGYRTSHIRTHILILQSAKATALHDLKKGEVKQAWLFSAPDAPTSSPYLRLAVQWCLEPVPYSFDYVGVWTEPTAVAIDPLFIAWLAYKPVIKAFAVSESTPQTSLLRTISSTQFFLRRRATPPSSSGRGGSKSGSGADMIHMRTRSATSSDKAESREAKHTPNQDKEKPQSLWSSEQMMALHQRLRRMYVNVELGLTLVYVTMTTASAVDCDTIRDAMEWHASELQRVLAISLGRIFLFSSLITKHFWHEINHDGPTLIPDKKVDATAKEGFPWRMRLADISCYTLEVSDTDRYTRDTGLRSQLRTACIATPKTVLELVTTTVTLSVVTKSIQYKTLPKPEPKVKKEAPKAGETKLKYFKSGIDFKPTTLKEFVRGPAHRKKSTPELELKKPASPSEPVISTGPLLSIGVNIHADTPPLLFRLEQNQVRVVSSAVHCFAHIMSLIRQTVTPPQRNVYTSVGGSQRSLGRSVSEVDHGAETPSDETLSEKSELISIFEAKSAMDDQINVKTFFWFQWVVSRVNIVVATQQVKLAFDIDDIISTIDLQNHYNQLKIKVASASVRYFQKGSNDDWTAGSLGGRVLEAREPTNSKEDNHFLSITITQARISNLPASWKQELHPKLLEDKSATDSMWEIYATLAPLEAVLQPNVLSHIRCVIDEMSPRSFCPLQTDQSSVGVKPGTWQWPFLYISAGGMRLLVTREHESSNKDDTFIFVMGKVNISPHPENPICRRTVNASDWTTPAGGLEGRQYEVLVRHVAIRSSRFQQLINEENSLAESLKGGTGSENPAVKWTQPVVKPVITPVLHSVDIGCVVAPAYYSNNVLVCGPALELNLMSDCAIEFSLEQLALASKIAHEMRITMRDIDEAMQISADQERSSICPYAPLLMTHQTADVGTEKQSTMSLGPVDEPPSFRAAASDTMRSVAADSGVDSFAPSTHRKLEDFGGQTLGGLKKTVSVAFLDNYNGEASEHLEIFVTMGMIEVSLYTVDDGSPSAESLRAPEQFQTSAAPEPDSDVQTEETLKKESKHSVGTDDGQKTENASAPSLTENVRNLDIGKTKLELPYPHARKCEGNLPLLHLTLYQPNLYYWRKKTQKTLQVSIFNAWLGLGAGQYPGLWHEELFSTARGVSDPLTDIPPALATLKIVVPLTGSQPVITNVVTRGNARLDIERPVMFEVSSDRLSRLKTIYLLVKEKLGTKSVHSELSSIEPVKTTPFMNKLKRMLVHNSIESITVQMSQVAVSGSEGVAGWDTASIQLTAGGRPERLQGRALITAFVVSAGPPGDTRHVLLHPLVLGFDFQATWEAWRRAEGGIAAREPMIRVTCELDQLTCDVRPAELEAFARMYTEFNKLMKNTLVKSGDEENSSDESVVSTRTNVPGYPTIAFESRPSIVSIDAPEEHFYKDDLRSGAFKLVSGGQLPMAYQVTLHNETVSWRYPHPRAITRLIAFPLPGEDVETPCVLELYDFQLNRWDRHTFFKIPVGEPIELLLYVTPPDAVFSMMWRYRACRPSDQQYQPYEFDINKFMPGTDTMQAEQPTETLPPNCTCTVTAEQLSGVVRVDSCFSPRAVPRVRFVTRVARLDLHLHNEPPAVASNSTSLEGYYVSKPLMRSHRVLTLSAKDLTAHAQLASPAGTLLLLETILMSDCINCTTGTLEPLIEEFHLEGGLSLATDAMARARIALSHVYAALHVPRLRTLHALARDWRDSIELNFCGRTSSDEVSTDQIHFKYEVPEVTAAALEGLVSLWILNTCAYSLRVGQEGTDEVVPLGSGASLAYRWRCPNAPKTLRFAIASPSANWLWSSSIPFSAGSHRVQLYQSEQLTATGSAYLYTKTEEIGARKCMTLSGRLVLANMLRNNLLYKVRGHNSDQNQWRTLCSGEISAETLGKSVICGDDADMALKIKFVDQETGWSGDIPLRECPKENVPWLVKVPRESETYPFMSVWCRVMRARSDGRIFAAIWPLYMLYSHLPLDANVIIESVGAQSYTELNKDASKNPPAVVHPVPGRGTCTHLLVPGTTAARHMLSFQYSNIECPVTHEPVPLHYGVTDTSVFEKRPPIGSIDEVMQETTDWLKRSGFEVSSAWPYSIVTKHWPGQWKHALIQPRCDVVVRYQAVRAGGGCSLEVQLCPVVLLCNAAPIALTLRAHDAAPLCKLEPGTAISPPSGILKKSFFISVEMGRDTFVSGELSVSGAELGRYGAAPPGRVALDRPAELAIQCNHKVAMLTMYYEIKEDINVLGMSSTYVLINSMGTDISISAIAVPSAASKETVLRPNMFKVVEPTKDGSIHGMSLCRFWVWGRWRGSDPEELRLYLFVTLSSHSGIAGSAPIRLGHPPMRRAIALTDAHNKSVPVVVTQIKHEGRWVVRVARDPRPQLVVHNRTRVPLVVAQPIRSHEEPGTSMVVVQQECLDTKWFCVIAPDAMTHYSTPLHCLRYPPPPNGPTTYDTIAFLTFSKYRDDADPEWCAPIAATDGEQLLQLKCGMTVKLRVRTHPHSTHLELRDVDERDISASDIRKRLFALNSPIVVESDDHESETLERIDAEDKLLVGSQGTRTGESHRQSVSLPAGVRPPTPTTTLDRCSNPSSLFLFSDQEQEDAEISQLKFKAISSDSLGADTVFREVSDPEWDETASWSACERIRVVAASIGVSLAATSETRPLVALQLDRAAVLVRTDARRTKVTISAGDVQIDNLQYETGQFDFGVVASTRSAGSTNVSERIPPLWNLFAEKAFATKLKEAKMLLKLTYDSWEVLSYNYRELTEIEISIGPLALYVEDLYVTSIAQLLRHVTARTDTQVEDDGRSLQVPLALRLLHIHPLDLTLTLHTAVRMYIALDQSPLRLSAFKLTDTITSAERLTHALTVHYLSAAILGAGWVVGGLELLGAPGALAARVGGATGGVRGVASAAAAALLRSLSAWAGSLARNLDLLAGDEEHARRAAAARRRPPPSFMAGLAAGITNFAINILGAVGGLAHHPLVGVAVGESDSGATGLRRGLLGALAKPLSATADLVAFAGHGLLSQTGWDPVPQPCNRKHATTLSAGWRRDCVRWSFRLSELTAITGFHVLLGSAALHLLLTHKFLVVADPDSERIVEMIDFKFCSIGPYQGQIIELLVTQKRQSRVLEARAIDEDDEYQISAAAMARVARYTGAEGTSSTGTNEVRVLTLLPAPGYSHALHAALTAAVHHNAESHFPLL